MKNKISADFASITTYRRNFELKVRLTYMNIGPMSTKINNYSHNEVIDWKGLSGADIHTTLQKIGKFCTKVSSTFITSQKHNALMRNQTNV